MLSRRSLLKLFAVGATGLILPQGLRVGKARGDEPFLLDPLTHPKYQVALPRPTRLNVAAGGNFLVEIKETVQWLGLVDRWGDPLPTSVWGYGVPGRATTFPGPTLVARRDVPIGVKWTNKLPKSRSAPYNHLLPLDQTVHWADPAKGGIPVVTHLHGGHSESASDGLPDAWFTQGFAEKGPDWQKQTSAYDNDQEAATLWYHDHALGMTRLNVYAGLAGFYLLRDDNENRLVADGVLPGGRYEVEIAIQDRMFNADGQLYLPSELESDEFPWAPSPSIVAEFFGDFILVNGAVWPVLEVEPRKYRLRLLNGSDSRFYVLKLSNGQLIWQIGTDGGLLYAPVALDRLVIGPGERADVILDFSAASWGEEIVLVNDGPDEPFKGFDSAGRVIGGSADPATTGQIMLFRASLALSDLAEATVEPGTPLREPITPLAATGATRQLILFEGTDEYGRLKPALGTVNDGALAFAYPSTETPELGDVEVWELYNTTEDAHPIHLHLVQFQILDRQSFKAEQDPVTGAILKIQPTGRPRPAAANESGWKDTAQMFPGEVTRIAARFDRPGRYVWHCHILSHEDHEMMRPYQVGPGGRSATVA